MKPIFKRPRAEADLVEIWNFIAEAGGRVHRQAR
jgi:hypothetical protein